MDGFLLSVVKNWWIISIYCLNNRGRNRKSTFLFFAQHCQVTIVSKQHQNNPPFAAEQLAEHVVTTVSCLNLVRCLDVKMVWIPAPVHDFTVLGIVFDTQWESHLTGVPMTFKNWSPPYWILGTSWHVKRSPTYFVLAPWCLSLLLVHVSNCQLKVTFESVYCLSDRWLSLFVIQRQIFLSVLSKIYYMSTQNVVIIISGFPPFSQPSLAADTYS